MKTITDWFRVGKNRRYSYRVVNAVVAAFVVYGVLNGEQSAAILLVANAALGLADANVTE